MTSGARAVGVALLALALCCVLVVAAADPARAAAGGSGAGGQGGDVASGPVAAQATVPAPPTSTTVPGQGDSPIPRIIPLPNSGQAPQDPGDRGGWLQISLFWFILATLGLLALLVYRDGRRKKRKAAARRAAPGAGPARAPAAAAARPAGTSEPRRSSRR